MRGLQNVAFVLRGALSLHPEEGGAESFATCSGFAGPVSKDRSERAPQDEGDFRITLAVFIAFIAASLLTPPAHAALDLTRAAVTRLDNGLTLIVLEEHSRPIVSVQMLYKVGGRDDPAGRMGLAHFFEHMAFRASKNFPGTGLVSEIYDVGGEWHGYTWIDQTTYFATAPASALDLLLRIEADRMGRLKIDADNVKAEFGAVLAEMNLYENDLSSVLFDAVLAAHFPVHPYGNNTIGYEGDIAAITKADLDDFYRRHIRPNTAVLAIAGDVDRENVANRVKRLFGKFKSADPVALPPEAEPESPAVRRIRIEGGSDGKRFQIAYRAPAASSPDFAAFLILQELAGGGSGVNFRQNDWGTPVRDGGPLARVADNVTTWFIPTAQSYVFLVSGEARANADERRIENAVDSALAEFAARPVAGDALAAARNAVKRALVLDIETTEDAAHELAFFDGVGALDQRLALPALLDKVTPEDLQSVARRWLDPDRRTIGWLSPGRAAATTSAPSPETLAPASPRDGASDEGPAQESARVATLSNGTSAIIERSALSPTLSVKIIAAGRYECATCAPDDPAPGYTSLAQTGLADELQTIVAEVKTALAAAKPTSPSALSSDDPEARLEELFAARFDVARAPANAAPALTVVVGDIDPEEAQSLLEKAIGPLPAPPAPAVSLKPSAGDVDVAIGAGKSQGALGYAVAAPAFADDDAMAWRLALYILTHHYGGRLGDEAISRRGLIYYIGSDYRSGGGAGLVTLSINVDPEKHDAMIGALRAELARLLVEPPSEEELAAAKRHFLGRRTSAAQSGREIADALAHAWVQFGTLRTDAEFAESVESVTLDDLKAILPAFTKGDIVSVRVKETDR